MYSQTLRVTSKLLTGGVQSPIGRVSGGHSLSATGRSLHQVGPHVDGGARECDTGLQINIETICYDNQVVFRFGISGMRNKRGSSDLRATHKGGWLILIFLGSLSWR